MPILNAYSCKSRVIVEIWGRAILWVNPCANDAEMGTRVYCSGQAPRVGLRVWLVCCLMSVLSLNVTETPLVYFGKSQGMPNPRVLTNPRVPEGKVCFFRENEKRVKTRKK